MVRTILISVVAPLCLALLIGLVYLGRCPPEAIPLYLAAWAAPGLLDRQRGGMPAELATALRRLDAQPVPRRDLGVPVPELPLSDQARIDAGWVIPEPSEPTQVGPPPLAAIPGRPGAELGAVIQATAEGTPESRALNERRLAAELRVLKGVGLLLLLQGAGCAQILHTPWGENLGALGLGAAALLSFVVLGLVASDFAREMRGYIVPRRKLRTIVMMALLSSACSPVVMNRYRTALAACEMGALQEAPAGIQDAVSRALHLPPDGDWRGALQGAALDFGARIGAKAAGCLVDAEVLRYAFAEGGVSSSHKALTVEGRTATPSELARARAAEWSGRGQ